MQRARERAHNGPCLLALVGDLVALIFHFLQGELTTRFLLKVAVVLVLAGTAFAYYLRDLRQDEEEPAPDPAAAEAA